MTKGIRAEYWDGMRREMNAISDASAELSRTRCASVLSETHRGDQRVNERYPITLELQYKLLNKGRGRIVRCDTNSKVIAVRAEHHEFHTAGVRSPKGPTMVAGAVS